MVVLSSRLPPAPSGMAASFVARSLSWKTFHQPQVAQPVFVSLVCCRPWYPPSNFVVGFDGLDEKSRSVVKL